MPLYEYECKKCHHRFELIQKFSDPPVSKCPQCKGKVQKLLSPVGLHFKGSGWYVTDYARKGKSETVASTTDGAKDSGTSKSTEGSKSSDKPASQKPKQTN